MPAYDDVFLHGVIGVDVTAASIREELDQYSDKTRKVRVRIHSEGGSYIEAAAIHNVLATLEQQVITYVEGACYSAASIPLMAGKEIQMCNNTLMMLHKPTYKVPREQSSEYSKKQKENLDRVTGLIVDSLSSRTKRSKEDIAKLLDAETWMTAEEALAQGFIDKVVEASGIPVPIENYQIPDRIVAIFRPVDKGDSLMALKDVVAKLHIKGVAEDADDKTMTDAIVNHFGSNVRRRKPKPTPTVPSAIVNLVKENRTAKLLGLVNHKDGAKITPAVKDELLALYCTDDTIVACLNTDFIPTDNFDKVIEALEKNKTVVNLGGSSGKQTLGKDDDDDSPEGEESITVKRMKARNKN